MSKLKVAVIGGGGIAGAHLPQLQAREDAVELVAIADVNQDTAQKTAEQYGAARVVADYHDVLNDVDAVVICVPTFLHADIAVDCINAGKAVFCEKPLTRTREQADAIEEAVSTRKAAFQVGFVRRFDHDWQLFHDAVRAGKLGNPIVWRDVMAGSGPMIPWFNIDEKGGGPFLDGCIHNIDFALSMFGAAEWAFCHGRTLRDVNTAIDTGTATVRFQSGDELMLAWSWGLPPGSGGNTMFEMFGARGILLRGETEDGEPAYVINHGDMEDKETLPIPPNALTEAFAHQMDEFIEVARGEKKPRAGLAEGRASLEVALAILESARSNQVVKVK